MGGAVDGEVYLQRLGLALDGHDVTFNLGGGVIGSCKHARAGLRRTPE